jgi:hypothetical protein
MKQIYKLSLIVLMAFGMLAFAQSYSFAQRAQEIFTMWDFNEESLDPTIGQGTATNIGGTTYTWAAGVPGNPDRGWNTSSYPPQGEASGTAGAEFMVSTAGYENIMINYFHRASGTASRWAQFEYTTDGGNDWVVIGNNDGGLSPHDTFYEFNIDLSDIAAVNDNPGFGFRVVSIFSPFAFDQNESLSYGPNEAYQRANAQSGPPGTGQGTGNYGSAGTWRFDDVAFWGSLLVGLGENKLASTRIYSQSNMLHIASQQDEPLNVTVYDLLGNTLLTTQMHSGNGSFLLPASTGLVLVNLSNEKGLVHTRKLIIQK